MNSIKNIVTTLLASLTLLAGMLAFAAPAANAAGDGTSIPPSARVWAKSVNMVSVEAKAEAVAIAGAEAKGKILLEEFRAQVPQSIQDKWKPPTREELDKYGTIAHSLAEAQAMVTTQVTAYKKMITDQQLKIKKLKIKIKFAKKHGDHVKAKKLKKRLKKARKQLTALYVDKDWRYRPLIGLARGVCYVNTGLNGNLGVQSFEDCVGDPAHPNEDVVWIGYSAVFDEMRIVAVENADGTIDPGCLNIPDFEVPPGTLSEALFLVVKSFAQAKALVELLYSGYFKLTVGGELTCPDGTIVRDEKTKVFQSEPIKLTKEVNSPKSVEEAIAFGEEQAKTDVSAQATAAASVRDSKTYELAQELVLTCPNQLPTVGIRPIQHTYPGGIVQVIVFGSDPEDGGNVNLTYQVSSNAQMLTAADGYPETDYVEGNQRFRKFWVRVKPGTGGSTWTVTANTVDQKGDKANPPATLTVPIPPDEF